VGKFATLVGQFFHIATYVVGCCCCWGSVVSNRIGMKFRSSRPLAMADPNQR